MLAMMAACLGILLTSRIPTAKITRCLIRRSDKSHVWIGLINRIDWSSPNIELSRRCNGTAICGGGPILHKVDWPQCLPCLFLNTCFWLSRRKWKPYCTIFWWKIKLLKIYLKLLTLKAFHDFWSPNNLYICGWVGIHMYC